MPGISRAEGASHVVGNITSLPSFIATPTTRGAEGGKSAAQEANEERRAAVSVDADLAEYKSDVAASREDVAAARSALDLFIGVARAARSLLLEARDLALRAADPGTQDAARTAQDVPFKALVQELAQLVDGAIGKGAAALAGVPVPVDADPDAAQDLEIPGLDLRLKAKIGDDEGLRLTTSSTLSTREDAEAAARAADESIARIDAGLRRIETGALRLNGHHKLLSALDSALGSSVRVDLDADAARLIALQVRQDLSRSTSPLANAAPSAVLALFRE
jgi:flagellin